VLVAFQQNAGAMNLFITDLRLLRCSGVSGGGRSAEAVDEADKTARRNVVPLHPVS